VRRDEHVRSVVQTSVVIFVRSCSIVSSSSVRHSSRTVRAVLFERQLPRQAAALVVPIWRVMVPPVQRC